MADAAAADPLFTGVPRAFVACHWHGDVFDLPRGATHLASSMLTANQAFRYGRNAYAFLFHMELTAAKIQEWVANFADELRVAGLNGTAIKLNAHTHLPVLQRIGNAVFERWVGTLWQRQYRMAV